MMKKTEDQTKKKGMYLVATFGTVAFIALGALAVGMMRPESGKTPKPIDLNSTPTPGPVKPTDGAKQDRGQTNTPMPTIPPREEQSGSVTGKPEDSVKQTAQTPEVVKPVDDVKDVRETQTATVDEPEGDVAVLSPEGVIKGLNFSAETGMLWPVTGEALIPFSPDHAIYHKTLDSYRVSDYVLLGSEVGNHVSAAADGVVTSVKEDFRTGTTVSMRVSEQHEIVYGLLSDVTVREGDFVDEGTVFAKVAEPTRYFLEDGSGVYVQVLEEGEAVNPMLFLR